MAVTIVGGCALRTGGDPDQENEAESVGAEPQPVLPIAEPPISRARLLHAVARAASSHASGVDDSEAQRLLDGKQFNVRVRFGCQADPGQALTWTLDSDKQTLRFRASPDLSIDDGPIKALVPPATEAAEGFWLERPWMLTAACPALETQADASRAKPDEGTDNKEEGGASGSAGANQRIGIAQFFASEDGMARRRLAGPYDAVIRLEEGQQPGDQGYDFVLAGRLRALANGRVIMCTGDGRRRPPDCAVSVDIDRAWIETPAGGQVLAQWGN